MEKEKFLKKLAKMLDEDIGQLNTNNPPCPFCKTKMNFYGHSIDENGNIIDWEYGKGYWECPSCGFKCTEEEVSPYMND